MAKLQQRKNGPFQVKISDAYKENLCCKWPSNVQLPISLSDLLCRSDDVSAIPEVWCFVTFNSRETSIMFFSACDFIRFLNFIKIQTI